MSSQCWWGRGLVIAVVVTVGATCVSSLHGQTAYKAANAPTTIVPRSSGFIHADFAEARLSLSYVREFLGAGLGIAPYVGAAARKGQVDLFSAFDFNPGFEVGMLGFASLGGGSGSLNVLSLGVGFQSTERKLLDFTDDSATVTFSEQGQSDLIVSAGLNLELSADVVLGLGGSVRREWSSPGVTQAVEACVEPSGPGALNVPLCENRYAIRLRDYWAGQTRADLLWRLLPLGGARSAPHLALLFSSSTDFGQDAAARWNVGAGVGVAPLRYPGHMIVAFLMELYDVMDANGEAPNFGDRFVTRVELGITFDLLVN